MKPFDPSKPFRTREGREAKIYAIYTEQNRIHGAYLKAGLWMPEAWTLNGMFFTDSQSVFDLVNITTKHKIKVWINVYIEELNSSKVSGIACKLRYDADKGSTPDRIACIERELEFEEGEGL